MFLSYIGGIVLKTITKKKLESGFFSHKIWQAFVSGPFPVFPGGGPDRGLHIYNCPVNELLSIQCSRDLRCD